MLIAVDYDDTILVNGSVDRDMLDYLKEKQREGAKIFLWTARQGQSRNAAVAVCEAYGLVFDSVVEGKVLADMYIDDKAVRPGEVIGRKKQRGITRQRLTSMRGQRG